MFDQFRLKDVLAQYKQSFVSTQWGNEKYKWEAVKWFQDNWDVNASDFPEMLSRSLDKTFNLLASNNNFPKGMIVGFAKAAPEEVRAMFIALFDESQDVFERMNAFKMQSSILLEKYGNGAAQHYQYENAISTYLWLRYPDKYYIYKFGEVKTVSSELESDYRFKKGAYADNIRNFLRLYDEISAALKEDTELVNLFQSQLTDTCYPDPDLAHAHGMYLLADEAHGTHFYFGDNMPLAGMKAGADFAAVSMHKSGGSLTQSSFLLTADTVNEGYVRQIINLMQTTSGSYLLMSSLDISRRNLALHGREIFAKVQSYAQYMRDEINEIGGYYAFSKELCDGGAFYDFDVTKLSIHTRDIGLAGIEVYDILRDRYGIQIEFGDIGNILAYVSIGDRELYLDRLIGALNDIKRIYSKDKTGMLDHEYINPIVKLSPQDAFYGNKKSVPIEQSSGKISGEFVMCYPPG